ncbi:hypothetical protein KEM54_004368 [Ascosphaera aggregata]|nr:hypothetical protein KEM54_004368 [Ascosphaera aggregata]
MLTYDRITKAYFLKGFERRLADYDRRLCAIDENEGTSGFNRLFVEVSKEQLRLRQIYETTCAGRADVIELDETESLPSHRDKKENEAIEASRKHCIRIWSGLNDLIGYLNDVKDGKAGLRDLPVRNPNLIPQAMSSLNGLMEEVNGTEREATKRCNKGPEKDLRSSSNI